MMQYLYILSLFIGSLSSQTVDVPDVGSALRLHTTIQIFAITSNFSVGNSTIQGYRLAIDAINRNASLLPNYEFNLSVHNSEGDSTKALLFALDICYHNNRDNNSLYIPIVLGCDWSSLSAVTAPTLSAFNWAQISASSTSVILSETSSFTHFYRTISDDTLQAESLIYFCQQMEWEEIGIIHVNDNYGVYLAVKIAEMATDKNMDVNSVAFERDKQTSYFNAVRAMKQINVYIIILVSHGDADIQQLLFALLMENMMDYPYYYLATDGWMDPVVERSLWATNQGVVGTFPWQPHSLNTSHYREMHSVYKTANEKYTEIENAYHTFRELNDLSWSSEIGTRLIYAYDSAMAMAYALDLLEEEYGLWNLNAMSSKQFVDNISNAIRNNVSFASVTGNVSFDKDIGDREDGMYSFGFFNEEGDIEYIGFSYYQKVYNRLNNKTTKKFVATIDMNRIRWPKAFEERGMTPRSSMVVTPTSSVISLELFITMTVLALIAIVVTASYLIVVISCDDNDASRRRSHKTKWIMYVGVILAYSNMIISGLLIDDRFLKNNSLDALCNVKVWWMVLSFSLIFTPIFAETYKLSRIFTELLITAKLDEMEIHLIRSVAGAVGVDLLLLIIFTSLSPWKRVYHLGDLVVIDELRGEQRQFGTCSITDAAVSYAFYVCVGVWKLVETVFGIYVSIVVSRMSFKANLWLITSVIVVFCITALLLTFGPRDDPDFQYAVMCGTTLLAVNIVVFQDVFVKCWIQHDLKRNPNSKYTQEDLEMNDEEKMKKLLITRLREIAKSEHWVREFSTTTSAGLANETINESDEIESIDE